ncbi:hypothetical protein CRV01_05650 [Arcobacter sp. CECT 8983]|uniref:hypothetical protein n=1 Tax=Arcobacter sp. CECT 8983 TaxID=2044508 RepID=UPI00100B5DB1|nr:hypothetical protein [Arcobacter sp. CECT 8983]RXJ90633.1 hypothetical protein CRV01_05650 [Arcobacter sp. CECT 8983]
MNICNKRGCNREVYNEYKQCIFHCDKSSFESIDINLFWDEIRNTYVSYSGFNHQIITNEVQVSNVVFPIFQDRNYSRGLNFYKSRDFHRYQHNKDIYFTKCIFSDDFDFSNFNINAKLIFKDCTFYGDIKANLIKNLELINCEFKSELNAYSFKCDDILIENTKFIKEVHININNNLEINKNVIFRNNFFVQGNSFINVDISNTQFDKHFEIRNTELINISDSLFKSSVKFTNENKEIKISNLIFPKDVSFEKSNNVEIKKVKFNAKIDFINESINNILFDESELNSLSLNCSNKVIFTNTKVNDFINLDEVYDSFEIYNCKVKNKIITSHIKNAKVNNLFLDGSYTQSQPCNDFYINNSEIKSLKIGTTNKIDILNCSINDEVNYFGDSCNTLTIKQLSCKRVSINKVDNLILEEVKKYPEIILKNDTYSDVNIKKSRLQKLESLGIVNKLHILNDTIVKKLELIKECEQVVLNKVKIKEDCIFPTIKLLEMDNKSVFFKSVLFNELGNVSIKETKFNEEVKFEKKVNVLSIIDNSLFKGSLLFSGIDSLSIIKSEIYESVIFSEQIYKSISIVDSEINSNIDFKYSKVENLKIESTDTKNIKTIIDGVIDFTHCYLENIEFSNTIFNRDILFNFLNNRLVFNKLKNVYFNNKIIINKVTIKDLFKDSINLKINSLDISNSNLSKQITNKESTDKTIVIKEIEIDNFKLKEVVIENDLNLENLKISKLELHNSNFEKIFRIKHSFIKEIESKDNIFEDLQIIDNKYNRYKNEKRDISLFNTTIKSGVFDKLKFNDFIMNDAHVSEAKIGYVEFDNASRETNRFFKNYYDSISDYITANKYYQKEMIEQMKDCKNWNSSEWWILLFNKGISNFGQSWLLPLFWIFIATLILYRIANFDLLSLDGFRQNHILWMFNDILKFSNPFTKKVSVDYGQFYWAWMFHKLLMTIFIYHFIVAVKRKTRR